MQIVSSFIKMFCHWKGYKSCSCYASKCAEAWQKKIIQINPKSSISCIQYQNIQVTIYPPNSIDNHRSSRMRTFHCCIEANKANVVDTSTEGTVGMMQHSSSISKDKAGKQAPSPSERRNNNTGVLKCVGIVALKTLSTQLYGTVCAFLEILHWWLVKFIIQFNHTGEQDC